MDSSAIGETRRGLKYKFYGGSEDVSGVQELRRVEEDEWTPVVSFSKRGKGGGRGRGRGRGRKGEKSRRGKSPGE